VTVPSPHPSDDDIADQIDRLRASYGEMNTVERPAAAGDYATIDLTGTRDGEEVSGLVVESYTYEIGSGAIVPEFDEELRGIKTGETITFTAPHPDPTEDEPVSYEVTIKELKERVLPEVTDEWVAEATEFETIVAFRDDIIDRLTKVRRTQASMAVQSGIGDKLAELVTDDVPEPLAGGEMRARLEDMVRRLSQQGITLEQYLQVTGTDAQAFTQDLRETAVQSCKVDLALRAIARAENLEPSEEDLDEEFAKMSAQLDMDVETIRERITDNDQMLAVKADLGNRAALRWLTDSVAIVDANGMPVPRDQLDLTPEDDDEAFELADHDHDGHDDDHDHDGHDHDHAH